MRNLLLLINCVFAFLLASCSMKPVETVTNTAGATDAPAVIDTLHMDTAGQRSSVHTVEGKELNPTPSKEVKRDSVKHSHEEGSPTKAKDDSIKAAKTKGKF